MRTIYLKCLDCDNVMAETEAGSAAGEFRPSWEPIAVCNNCGSDDLEEVGKCDVCDEFFDITVGTSELHGYTGRVCEDCLKKFADPMTAIKYGDAKKDCFEISDFFWRLFDKDEIHEILLGKAMEKYGRHSFRTLDSEALSFCMDDADDFSEWCLENDYYEEGD